MGVGCSSGEGSRVGNPSTDTEFAPVTVYMGISEQKASLMEWIFPSAQAFIQSASICVARLMFHHDDGSVYDVTVNKPVHLYQSGLVEVDEIQVPEGNYFQVSVGVAPECEEMGSASIIIQQNGHEIEYIRSRVEDYPQDLSVTAGVPATVELYVHTLLRDLLDSDRAR